MASPHNEPIDFRRYAPPGARSQQTARLAPIAPRTTVPHQPSPSSPAGPILPPSWDALHPYKQHNLRPVQSCNRADPRFTPDRCPECTADRIVDAAQRQFPPAGPAVHPAAFTDRATHQKHKIWLGPLNGAPARVTDVLEFRAGLLQGRLPHAPGPMQVSLRLAGAPPVDDIVFASCAHRKITTARLAYWLAVHFRVLAGSLGMSTDGLELYYIKTKDNVKWVASAGYPA
ncbi:hypothetical protein B0H15DRAFT_539859 [Mycena belliarum]|uniref:Uncharacterized protein n=1 Tax=Mycena belliarum TaxID=1033014 RepID=A0AAD6TSQ9_9AGAR|nr:hypothetical protein B0H15DRAFT_539859 [Mycena belliae]